MEEWDIKIVVNKNKGLGVDELERIAKKSGYKIIYQGETDNIIGVDAIRRGKGQPPKNISKEEILAMREKGHSMASIAKSLGVARSSIYNYLGKDYPKKR